MLSLQTRSALMGFSLQPLYLFIPGGYIRLYCSIVCPAHTEENTDFFFFVESYFLVCRPFFLIVCVCVCRGWPQMLASHWHSMLFGPGSYWTTPPWRQCWSFCASTQPVSPQVCTCVRLCLCVCVCLQALCLSEGTESHAIRTGQHCLPWLPLSNIVSHCLPPVPACLPVTIDRLLWQQVPDQ